MYWLAILFISNFFTNCLFSLKKSGRSSNVSKPQLMPSAKLSKLDLITSNGSDKGESFSYKYLVSNLLLDFTGLKPVLIKTKQPVP